MTTPKNCVFCTTTNRIIDFIPDGDDGTASIAKYTPEYGPALIVLDFDQAYTRYENQFKSRVASASSQPRATAAVRQSAQTRRKVGPLASR